MRRYEVLTRVATAAATAVGLATFGLTGAASAAASVGPVHDLPGEYNISGAGSLACTPGQPLATATCYLVGETGTFAYNATSSTNVVVPVTDGVVGTSVELPSTDYISYISCTSGPDCIGLGSNASGDTSFYWLDSGKLVKTVTTPHKGYYWDGLSCGSATYCVASGSTGVGPKVAGAVAVMSNGAVSLHRVATVIGNGVSCYGPTSCLVVGTSHQGGGTAYGTLVEVKAGVTGVIHTISATAYLGGVTCGWEAGTCRSTALVAAGSGGYYPAVAIIKGTTATVTKLPGNASAGAAVCPEVGQCVEFGVVNPNEKGEHAFVAVATGGVAGAQLTVPGVADVDGLSCPQVGACDGVGSLLDGPHGDYSLATFTVRY
jgi:hypothetical protein